MTKIFYDFNEFFLNLNYRQGRFYLTIIFVSLHYLILLLVIIKITS